jgi:hypothetical protein
MGPNDILNLSRSYINVILADPLYIVNKVLESLSLEANLATQKASDNSILPYESM